MKNRLTVIFISVVLLLSMTVTSFASVVNYLPGVTSQMSKTSFWSNDDEVLMSWNQITELNCRTISTASANMYDLKNHYTNVNGVALNSSLRNSSQADASYYLGWTYIESNKLAVKSDFDEMINNTQNTSPSTSQEVLYAVAVNRTELRTFPSFKAIWDSPYDPETDYQCLSSVRVNEPLIITSVSSDKQFYLAKNDCCSGWIAAKDVAICKDKEEWLSAWDISPENALVVYGDKVYTEMSMTGPKTSELLLTMGTVLEIADIEDPNNLIDNRAAYQNFAVYIPVRNEDGSYSKKLSLISENEKVHIGYLPMTRDNIVMVALSALGNTYGWGGGILADDCSGYIRNVYRCFGLLLARNTTWQSAMPMTKVDMSKMIREEREALLDSLPVGTILFFKGHEMLYLGKYNGDYYVISALGNILEPFNGKGVQRVSSVVINSITATRRASKIAWIDALNLAVVPYWNNSDLSVVPDAAWYRDGVSYCVTKGIMSNYADEHFHPDETVTRAQFVKYLWNLEGKPITENTDVFTDIKNDADYIKALDWAVNNNLVFCHNKPDIFAPDVPVTREMVSVILYRYVQYKGYDVSVGENTNILSYDDIFDVSSQAIPAMQYVLGSGIINGKTISTINPHDVLTRAETACIFHNFSKIC